MKMGNLENIQSFETSIENGNLQSYDEQSIFADLYVQIVVSLQALATDIQR